MLQKITAASPKPKYTASRMPKLTPTQNAASLLVPGFSVKVIIVLDP